MTISHSPENMSEEARPTNIDKVKQSCSSFEIPPQHKPQDSASNCQGRFSFAHFPVSLNSWPTLLKAISYLPQTKCRLVARTDLAFVCPRSVQIKMCN